MNFEWDSDKDRVNQRKHKISFSTAKNVFKDKNIIELPDEEHSRDENRYIALGMIKKVVFVYYTIRHSDTIRIISARIATKGEEEFYYAYNGISRFE